MAFIGTLALILFVTVLLGHFSQRIGIPAVIGELLAGIIFGPALLNWIQPSEILSEFAEIGVIILMFMAGLESDLALLKKYLKPAILVATVGVIFPVFFMGGASRLFGFSNFESLFIGVIFSATSVSISVEVLKELQRLNTKEGATILGAAVADDILGVILLSVMISLFATEGVKTGGGNSNLALTFGLQIAYFIGLYVVVKWVIPVLMHLSQRILVGSGPIIMAVMICLAMSYMADLVGLSSVIGAFFAGIGIAQTPIHKQIDLQIEPIGYAIFIPVFFVSVGLEMSFKNIWQSLPFIIIMSILAILTKLIGCGLGAKWSGFDTASSYTIGAGMVSRGEVALIVAQIGFSAHLLSNKYYSDVVIVIILVTLIAPFILKHALNRQSKLQKNE